MVDYYIAKVDGLSPSLQYALVAVSNGSGMILEACGTASGLAEHVMYDASSRFKKTSGLEGLSHKLFQPPTIPLKIAQGGQILTPLSEEERTDFEDAFRESV